MFGQDPAGQKVRGSLAQETHWICDSNILHPLLARECHSHEFAKDLYGRMRDVGIQPVTTTALIAEAYRGFKWAPSNCSPRGEDGGLAFVQGIVQDEGYRENLFIDGFIRGAQKGFWETFQEYAEAMGDSSLEAIEQTLRSYGVQKHDWGHYAGASEADLSEIEGLTKRIHAERTQRNISRGEEQARAEAEVLHIIRRIRTGVFSGTEKCERRAYFLSTSRLLDSIFGETDGLLTWSPDSLFRHLSFFAGDVSGPDELFESLATNYYAMGVSIIDENIYRVFFKPAIGAARLKFQREKDRYLNAVEQDVQEHSRKLESQFEATPDLEKVLFVEHMGWKVAQRTEQRIKQVEAEAMERTKALKQELDLKDAEWRRNSCRAS